MYVDMNWAASYVTRRIMYLANNQVSNMHEEESNFSNNPSELLNKNIYLILKNIYLD